MPSTAQFIVEVDGSPLPSDVNALLSSAYVDDSLRLPDLFFLRFRDSQRIVVAKSGAKIGSKVKVSVLVDSAQTPEVLISGEVTALEAEFDGSGTFTVIRGYDKAHRLFRGRRTAAYTQMTASDIATQVAQRAGLAVGEVQSTSTVFEHLSQAGVSDWEFLDGLARDIGYEVAVRESKLFFGRPRTAADAPAGGAAAPSNPLALVLGKDLLRFRSVVTAAEQVKEVQVRGWDIAQKQALVATAPARTTSVELATANPADIAEIFGGAIYVGSDTAYRTQAEVDSAAVALSEQIAGAFAEFEGVSRGNPQIRARAAISIDGIGAPFDGKYTVTTSKHRFDPQTGYRTSFAVTGRQERSLLGLASGGSSAVSAGGPVVAQVSDVNDPQQEGRVTVTFPWLDPDYVSGWARTVQAGAGKDRGAMVLPEVGDEVLVVFEQGDFGRPYVLGGLYNGVDTPPTTGIELIDGSSGAINRRSMVSRQGHRIDLLDQDGQAEGVALATKDDHLKLFLDAAATTITVHSDGKILIEGAGGIVIDSAGSKMEFKAGEIAMTATSGIKIDGGGGSVSLNAGGDLTLKGITATLEGSAGTNVKSGSMVNITGPLVKLN